ncbi:transmembrane protein 230 [Citrus sinensis]|uniref:Transmembrane protein 230 n=1 Tax=Citrus sinensis TaxID=2711 RepID=A0ACB8K661_CITSI|nr:transmembrane protein 230 [Citrus sinensis]
MASRRNVQYSRLSTDDDDEYDGSRSRRYDPRFDYSPKAFDKIPWKSIVLALFLLCLGSLLLFLSLFIFTGHMGGETAQAFGLLVLGILAFLPVFGVELAMMRFRFRKLEQGSRERSSFYETRIAYYSWRGAEGYRFASIPDY